MVFPAIPFPIVEIGFPDPNQVIPSFEYPVVFDVPSPTATHRVVFHATLYPPDEKILVPIPVQVIPSLEYAKLFVP